jgi:hypothetical protein
MNPVEKALKLRNSLPLKDKRPFNAFIKRVFYSFQVTAIMDKLPVNQAKISKKRLKYHESILFELRRQCIVAMCAAYEIFWRDFFKFTFDQNFPSGKLPGGLRSKNIDIGQLTQIIGEKLTIGELISLSYTFRGTEEINTVVKNMLDFDLFARLSKSTQKFGFQTGKDIGEGFVAFPQTGTTGKYILQNSGLIEKAFKIRDQTVHNTAERLQLTEKQIAGIFIEVFLFNIHAAVEIEKIVSELCEKNNE